MLFKEENPNKKMPIIYTTCFYDIGRSDWEEFHRTFEEYLAEFEPFVELFRGEDPKEHKLRAYIDSRHVGKMSEYSEVENIQLIHIDENWLAQNTRWRDLEEERAVLESAEFQDLVGKRAHFPECRSAEYTMINHIKIDLLMNAYYFGVTGDLAKSFLVWVDFGFFKKGHLEKGAENYIPKRLLDSSLFDPHKINYTLINPIEEKDFDIIYTLQNAPEKVAGYFFILRADLMCRYQQLYHTSLSEFREQGYADDDQHLVLRCYRRQPDLFKFHLLPWHTALVRFQISEGPCQCLDSRTPADWGFCRWIGENLGWERRRPDSPLSWEAVLVESQISERPYQVLDSGTPADQKLYGWIGEILGWDHVSFSQRKGVDLDDADAMLTFLTWKFSLEDCLKVKKEFVNSKIYNIVPEDEYSETKSPSPGIIFYPCKFDRVADLFDGPSSQRVLDRDLRYLTFDIKIYPND